MKRLIVWFSLLLVCVACSVPEIPKNKAPLASFTKSISGLSVSFDASSSTDSDGSISSYVWSFGDGSSGSGITVIHTYATAGSFTVTLTVTDNQAQASSSSQQISVTESPSDLSISGKVSLGSTTLGNESSTILRKPQGALASSEAAYFSSLPEVEIIAGEVLLQFREGLATQASSLKVANSEFRQVRQLALRNTALFRAEGLSQGETIALMAALANRADIIHVSLNYRYYPLAIPNDPNFTFQWHYPAINMPQAWDQTVGSADTVVAVVDTGIINHPELTGRLLAGFDFVSNATNAGDGDGRDSDPTDPGPNEATGYHGTHVAGTIAANSNDASGIAGINWNAKILPVRVLGKQGGTFSDILDGVLWAAGLHPSLANPNPADVLNLSLGGTSPCEALAQQVFDQVIAAGKIVVVAAGNESQDARFVSPANCQNVITVGASDFAGLRAPYSNYGPRIDVMAPGGDTSADLNSDNFVDGVLSLGFNDNTQQFNFPFYQGTSMATPHVAGVASLMKALKPDISQLEVLEALRSTARPLSLEQCNGGQLGVGVADCGAGLIDANAALQTIDSTTPPPPPPAEDLVFNPTNVNFGTDLDSFDIALTNNSLTSLDWSVETFIDDADNPSEVATGVVLLSELSGSLSPGASQNLRVSVDRSLASADGDYHLDIEFLTTAGTKLYPIFFTKGIITSPVTGDLQDTQVLACFLDANQKCVTAKSIETTISQTGTSADYSVTSLAAGNYWIIGWKDSNEDDDINAGDFFGYYSVDSLGATVINPPASNIDFVLEELSEADLASNQAIRLWRKWHP